MKKNLYSLILSERVVYGIDRLAQQLGTNRSHLIDEILADYLQLPTPEKTVYSVFRNMEELMRDFFPVSYDRYDNVFSLKRALSYKYRPTLRYEIALFPSSEKTRAELRVTYRTQSRELEKTLNDFFQIFQSIEKGAGKATEYAVDEAKWTRVKYFDSGHGVSDMANELSHLVKVFDAMLEKYISNGYSSYDEIYADYNAKIKRLGE